MLISSVLLPRACFCKSTIALGTGNQSSTVLNTRQEVSKASCPGCATDGAVGAPCQVIPSKNEMSELQCGPGYDVSELRAKTIWGLLLVFRTIRKKAIYHVG